MTVLAVDVGRTTFRAAVFTEGSRGSSVQLDNGVTLSDPDGVPRLVGLLDRALQGVGSDALAGIGHVVVASAGAIFRPDQAEALLAALATGSYAGREVVVTTDIVAAHAGALDGRPGVVLAAGTGAVALAVDGAGTATLVDGAGYLVGDAGSGFDVGRAGLVAAMRHHDGRPRGSARLAGLAAEQFGPLAELPGRLQGEPGPARAVATFAPAVAQAARDGDAIAAAIWRDAVSNLADTAVAACEPLPEPDRRIAVTGGLFDLDDLVAEPFSVTMAARQPAITVRRAAGDALAGAAQMADGPAGVYERLLLRQPSSQRS